MAETKTQEQTLERVYIIPLRNEWRKVSNYRRAGRAARAIKKFIARHMKVTDRDTDKVKLDIYLNNEIWFRGKTKPPAKIKVKAIKTGEIVRVELAEIPQRIKFAKQKHEKRHKAVDVEPKEKPKEKDEKPSTEKSPEKKEEEKEKAQASGEAKAIEAKQELKTQKHVSKVKEESHHRMALQK